MGRKEPWAGVRRAHLSLILVLKNQHSTLISPLASQSFICKTRRLGLSSLKFTVILIFYQVLILIRGTWFSSRQKSPRPHTAPECWRPWFEPACISSSFLWLRPSVCASNFCEKLGPAPFWASRQVCENRAPGAMWMDNRQHWNTAEKLPHIPCCSGPISPRPSNPSKRWSREPQQSQRPLRDCSCSWETLLLLWAAEPPPLTNISLSPLTPEPLTICQCRSQDLPSWRHRKWQNVKEMAANVEWEGLACGVSGLWPGPSPPALQLCGLHLANAHMWVCPQWGCGENRVTQSWKTLSWLYTKKLKFQF